MNCVTIKRLRTSTEKTEAEKLYVEVSSMLDKLAKKNVIHKNKASNQKSKLAKVLKKVGTVVAKKSSKKKT